VEAARHVQQPRTAIVNRQEDDVRWQEILGLPLRRQSRAGSNAGNHSLASGLIEAASEQESPRPGDSAPCLGSPRVA
jgi:hypothetical protein